MNRAPQGRLEQDGLWEPSGILARPVPPKSEEARIRVLLAERSAWIKATGILGWRKELDRRRATRVVRNRERRVAPIGAQTQEGSPS